MKKIYKYQVEDGYVEMHSIFKIIRVSSQNSIFGHGPMMWAEVDITSPVVKVLFLAVPTGQAVPDGQYVGSFEMPDGMLFHLYLINEYPGA